MVVTDEKKRAIFDELARALEIPRQADNEITTREYADYRQCTIRKAYEQLMKAVVIGKMTKRKILANDHRCWAFRMVVDEETI